MDEAHLRTLWGQMLRQQRLSRGLTVQTVADALDVSQSTVTRWEMGHAEPRRRHKTRLAGFYGVPVMALFPEVQAVAA